MLEKCRLRREEETSRGPFDAAQAKLSARSSAFRRLICNSIFPLIRLTPDNNMFDSLAAPLYRLRSEARD
jgi:hypothetical protein